MSPAVIGWLALVAFVAGGVDAIAGGGGALTVPALLMAGLPTHLALGTNKGVSTFGTAAAAGTFARAGRLAFRRTALGFAAGAIGASMGAQLQLAFSPAALRPVVLVLLLVVAVALAVHQPRALAAGAADRPPIARHASIAFAIALVIGAYDGFFGPGTGTFLIVAFAVVLGEALGDATADAKPVNLGSNAAALVTFALRGTVVWKVALPMAVANVLGGVIGARIVVRGGDRVVRLLVIAVSLALVAKLASDWLRT